MSGAHAAPRRTRSRRAPRGPGVGGASPPPRPSRPRPLPSDVAELRRAAGRLCRIRGPEHPSGEVGGLLSYLVRAWRGLGCSVRPGLRGEAAGPALRRGPGAAGEAGGAWLGRRATLRGRLDSRAECGSAMTAAETPDKARGSPPPSRAAGLRGERGWLCRREARGPELPATWPPPEGEVRAGGAVPLSPRRRLCFSPQRR